MNKHDNVIYEIIKRYGDVINLKESPYLLVEIIGHYRNRFDDLADADSPCAGVPPAPPPEPSGPSSYGLRGNDLLKQISVMINIVENINKKLTKALSSPAQVKKSSKKLPLKKSKKDVRKKR